MLSVVSVFCLVVTGTSGAESQVFPPWFKFGAASAAYQVEGGWNVSDKGESIWDHLLHSRPELVYDGSSGDVACDSYHLWKRDIEMAEELGLDYYRFSISWTRLLPTGFSNYVSEDGKTYYNNLINGLLSKGIAPLVTIYHFDLPQPLQELGGWANPLVSEWFADYARVVFSLFADRVPIWLTMNEPIGICDNGYNKNAAPYLDDMEVGIFLCTKYTLLAHAKAYRIYDDEFRPKYHGKVSVSTMFMWFEPASPEDEEITDMAIAYWEGRFCHAIFSKEGGWPPLLQSTFDDLSQQQGYSRSRLPPFSKEEVELVKGTYDFYGLNHYTTRLVRQAKPGDKVGTWPFYGSEDLKFHMEKDPAWENTDIDWFTVYPQGLYRQLHWLKKTYDINEVMITENGYPSFNGRLDDDRRSSFIKEHLASVLLALRDGINVTGYVAWTMMDNFEWFGGYGAKFGLYAVDFSSPLRTRSPRDSARYLRAITDTRTLLPIHQSSSKSPLLGIP